MSIPIYLFDGFLESGKTSFIASVLTDPNFTRDEKTLIVQCEEGIEEYEPSMLKKTHSVVECVEDEDEFDGSLLRDFAKRHHPDRIIIEMNGMWDLDRAVAQIPRGMDLFQIITTVNAETFELYSLNMGMHMIQHISNADMVVFNRATEATRKLIRDRNIRSMNPKGSLYFENDDGTSEDYGQGMPPPYDLDAPVIDIKDEWFGTFFVHAQEEPEQYDGKVPSTRKALMALPGVGQKTAGVVLLAAFGDDQIPVDTHVFRVSRRIGLADANTPEKVEGQLRDLLDKDIWSLGHHLIIWHGRRCCHARKPECERCPLNDGLCEKHMEN